MGQDLAALADRLRERRAKLQKSAKDVAAAAGISAVYLWILERGINPKTGKPSRPSTDVLARLAVGLDLPLGELLSLAGHPTESSGAVRTSSETDDEESALADIQTQIAAVEEVLAGVRAQISTLTGAIGRSKQSSPPETYFPWEALDAAAFAQLVFQLLDRLADKEVQWLISEPRSAREQHADQTQPLSARRLYAIHRPGTELTANDLQPVLAERGNTGKLIVTSGTLSAEARELLGASVSRDLGYLEARSLEELISSRPELADLLSRYFGDALADQPADERTRARKAYFAKASEIWDREGNPEPRLKALAGHLTESRKHSPSAFTDADSAIYLKQHHDAAYLQAQKGETAISLTLANIGSSVITRERLTLTGAAPMPDARALKLKITGQDASGSLVKLQPRYLLDLAHVKIIEFAIPAGLPMYATFDYKVTHRWPYLGELPEIPRYYQMPIYALTGYLSFRISVHDDYEPYDYVLLEDEVPGTLQCSHDLDTAAFVLSGFVDLPRVGAVPEVRFSTRLVGTPAYG